MSNKTQENDASVAAFLDKVEPRRRQDDCRVVNEMMRRVTGLEPKMWGDSIVGFDRYHYKYESGREGDWFVTGYAPRKQALTVYIMPRFGQYEDLLARLGKVRTSVSCLYINRLENIDLAVLEVLVHQAYQRMKKVYGA